MGLGAVLRRVAAGGEPTGQEVAALAAALLEEPCQGEVFGLTAPSAREEAGQRLRRLPRARRAVGHAVEAAGYDEPVRWSAEELVRYHLPLAGLLAWRAGQARGRYRVAVAGVPGCGKTVFAAVLARVVEALEPPFGAIVLGLDGYHYPNAYLASRAGEGGPLLRYKGAPSTFDTARLAADLRRLGRGEGPLALPAYDRTLHEPVEGRIVAGRRDRLVLVEGNYLLCRDGPWHQVAEQFELRLFLDFPPQANREPVVARHVRGGRSAADAARHYERVDRPNAELAASTRGAADLVVELDARHAVRGLRRAEARP
ncbi:MAG: hypothetical protein ACLF0G_18220 [Candidatus Brocadiia bacterium]